MAIDAAVVARVTGIDTVFKDLRAGSVLFKPQRIAVFAQGASANTYSLTKFAVTSAKQVGDLMGYGSPAHLVVRELMPTNGDGVGTIPVTMYPLEDYDGVAATGDITPSGTQTTAAEYRVRIGGVLSNAFTVAAGAIDVAALIDSMVTAINAVLEMPMIAGDGSSVLNLTTKWEGASGNDIVVEIIGDTTLGTTFTITQPAGGLVNPDLSAAIDQIGDIWESLLINALNPEDETALDDLQVWGDGRWGELVRKPAVAFVGSNVAAQATATAVTSTRTDDKVNCQIPAPGSPNLPCVIAARAVARIAKLANTNPAHDYGSQKATGLLPGTDAEQWNHATRDLAVKAGSSTIEVKDGVVNLSDIVTMYAPTGENPPAYRYVVDIVKLMTIIYNLDLAFSTDEWDGAPLIPDDQPTVNRDAKKPKMAKALVAGIVDSLGDQAIISDPATAKDTITATINSQNPKRLDVEVTVQLSGNTNVKGITLNFGFYYGVAA